MKILSLILFVIISFLQIGSSQNTNKKELYNEKFNWTIEVPESFNQLDSLAILNLNEEEGDIPIHNIFTFQPDQLSLFEANYTEVPFEILYDVEEEIKLSAEEFYHFLLNEFPDSLELEIDTSYSAEWINHLEFKKFEMKITVPNRVRLTARIYLRQFGDQELCISYFYNTPEVGWMIRISLMNSKFEYPSSQSDSLVDISKPVEFQVKIPEEYKLADSDDYSSYINLATPEKDIKDLINPDEIVLTDTSAILYIDYPGVKEWYFDIASSNEKGFTRIELIEIICQKYHQVFEDPRFSLVNYDMSEIYFERRYDGKIVLTLGIDS